MIRLKNGLSVRRICACCRYKADDYPWRRCQLTGKDIAPDSHCRRWTVDDRYGNAHLGGGYVKTKDYLMFACTVAVENEQRPLSERIGIEDMRRNYKRMTGKGIVEL